MVCLRLLVERGRVVERVGLAVDPGPREALGLELPEQLDVLALAAADDRGEHLEPRALLERQDAVDDLLRGLPLDRRAAGRAVRPAGAGVEQAEVVVDLGDRADGGAGVLGGGLLVDRDRRRQALDEVDVGLVHLAEELAGVRRQRLDVPALALGEDRVERQGRLARPGEPREDDQGVAGQVEGDVLEVVLARAADDELVCHVRQPSHAAPTVLRSFPRSGWPAGRRRGWLTGGSGWPHDVTTSTPRAPSSCSRTRPSAWSARSTGSTDEALAAPRGCPDWTRAHVVAHLALNAEGLAGGADGRAEGEPTTHVPSDEARAADIEELAAADRAELRDRFLAGTTLVAEAVDAVPRRAWTETFARTPGGRVSGTPPSRGMRLREVEIHHVDLDAGYTPAAGRTRSPRT